MDLQTAKRCLIKHGVFLLFLGLLTGIVAAEVKNPRMGLSAHLEGIMAGMLLILLGGAVWDELRLSSRLSFTALWLSIYSAYATWAYTLLGALLGTSRLTPIAGKGFSATEWQETVVQILLVSEVIAILIAFCILLFGLRGHRARDAGSL
jgi:hydroxylaminobenzene mutase